MTYGFGYVDVDRANVLGIADCVVFVGGVEVKDCIAFNDDEGWADIYARDRNGSLISTVDGFVILRVVGKITLARGHK